MKMTLEYKGYKSFVTYNEADAVYHGKIEGIPDLVSFEGDHYEIISAFEDAVDDYIETRKKLRTADKPYFTKLLPIEGELKEGDQIMWNSELYRVAGQLGAIAPDLHVKKQEESRWIPKEDVPSLRPLRLFLCSHDIKVGDEVMYQMEVFGLSKGVFTSIDEEEGVKFYTVTGKESVYCFYPNNPEVSPPHEHPFKVMGEVSPEAKWVKEGDRFEEYEEWWFNQHGSFLKCIRGVPAFNLLSQNPNNRIVYKVKCPTCDNFH